MKVGSGLPRRSITDILQASPLVQALVSHAQQQGRLEDGGNSIVPSMAPLESRDSIVPAAPEGEEDIGVLPQEGRHFCHKGKCYLLTYACYVKGEDTVQASCHEAVKDLVDHLLTLRSGGGPLLESAMG
ncbi:hypothetical protein RHS02_09947, partial [Rhizoctonia solani]